MAPWSRDESGWGNLLTPIAVIAAGTGPTVALTAGSHGDEFEGQLALRRLVHQLEPSQVAGRVIVVPGLNHAAVGRGRRHSPIDGANMNRVFPGDPRGTVTERLADFVYRELVCRADVVLDLHSGGASMQFEPFVAAHDLEHPRQREQTFAFLRSFGTPLAVIMQEPDASGTLDSAVEQLGKVLVTTELGGGGGISSRSLEVTWRGVLNTLRRAEVIAGEPETPTPVRFVRMVEQGTALASRPGLIEPLADPGDEVAAGQPAARLHDLDDLDRTPVEVSFGVDGVVVMRHHPGIVAAGDPLFAVGVPLEQQHAS